MGEGGVRRSLPGDRALPALCGRLHDNHRGCRCYHFIALRLLSIPSHCSFFPLPPLHLSLALVPPPLPLHSQLFVSGSLLRLTFISFLLSSSSSAPPPCYPIRSLAMNLERDKPEMQIYTSRVSPFFFFAA